MSECRRPDRFYTRGGESPVGVRRWFDMLDATLQIMVMLQCFLSYGGATTQSCFLTGATSRVDIMSKTLMASFFFCTQKRTGPTHRVPDALRWCSRLAMDVGEGQKPVLHAGDNCIRESSRQELLALVVGRFGRRRINALLASVRECSSNIVHPHLWRILIHRH
jgi:hypothetical protein